MKERGILFSAPMVVALLAGAKRQTRRIIKDPLSWHGCATGDCPHEHLSECAADLGKVCPYGAIGDRLWVRETFAWELEEDGGAAVHPERFLYRADGDTGEGKWVPSIHMPRRASRITLELANIGAEYVSMITEDDAHAEGFDSRDAFLDLFFNVNKRAPRGSNPTVWVLDFKVLPK